MSDEFWFWFQKPIAEISFSAMCVLLIVASVYIVALIATVIDWINFQKQKWKNKCLKHKKKD